MMVWGITDIGLRRKENQDTYAFEMFGVPDTVVAVVCDGMGGANGGRIASSLAVSTFMDEMHRLAHSDMSVEEVRSLHTACVQTANSAVHASSREDAARRGMGTTLVSAIVSPEVAVLSNVGDSRAYHISSQGIRRVTRDHSVVESLIEAGDITREQARTHPNRNLITRALGPESRIECDTFVLPFHPGEYLLLCTDGLIVTAEDEEIRDLVYGDTNGERILTRLLELSKSRGAPDNVTVVLIFNGEEAGGQDG